MHPRLLQCHCGIQLPLWISTYVSLKVCNAAGVSDGKPAPTQHKQPSRCEPALKRLQHTRRLPQCECWHVNRSKWVRVLFNDGAADGSPRLSCQCQVCSAQLIVDGRTAWAQQPVPGCYAHYQRIFLCPRPEGFGVRSTHGIVARQVTGRVRGGSKCAWNQECCSKSAQQSHATIS